jgi:hypothetical protein
MKMLIYVGDLVTDVPSLFLGELFARHLGAEVALLHVAPKKRGKKEERRVGEELLVKAKEKIVLIGNEKKWKFTLEKKTTLSFLI